MTAATAPAPDTARESLASALTRRSPGIAAALDPERARLRAAAWAARAVPDAAVSDVRVGSVLCRPDGSCTLRYRVRLAPSGSERVLLVEVPRSGADVVVRPFPADPGLPTLPRAVDPVVMREVLGQVVPGTGGPRAVGWFAVDVVHHPRRDRCVLRYRLAPGTGGPGRPRHPVVFGKVYADPAAPAAAAAALRLLRTGLRPLPDGTRVAVPRPLAVVPGLRLGLVEEIPGRPVLPELLTTACRAGEHPGGTDPHELPDAVATAARLAAAVHACSPDGAPLPVRTLDGERAATESELALLEPVWPGPAARLRRGLDRALRAAGDPCGPAATRGPSGSGLAHGDLTPGQVLVDGTGGAGLVDVDTLCLAEPALDLGRFLAYLQVTGVRRAPSAEPLLAELSALFVASWLGSRLDQRPAAGGTRPPAAAAVRELRTRTAAYRALALARMGASACRQLKDDRLGAVLHVLDSAADGRGADG
ncbi:phosphotransferase [Geodermatophilus sp. YIM 151500]|uniref:phosphotransferase family protein n=1 Tax=Geodermatophilus sp. YIM 151500 TaxID=2984531 RepID=UPI0021E386EF|nr:phosphotransferase [Geodermatophilus sp. YIM 151500]MCV2491802.1 phosphotransferase [Geodermatophilus sp. YIM 151500]